MNDQANRISDVMVLESRRDYNLQPALGKAFLCKESIQGNIGIATLLDSWFFPGFFLFLKGTS